MDATEAKRLWELELENGKLSGFWPKLTSTSMRSRASLAQSASPTSQTLVRWTHGG